MGLVMAAIIDGTRLYVDRKRGRTWVGKPLFRGAYPEGSQSQALRTGALVWTD